MIITMSDSFLLRISLSENLFKAESDLQLYANILKLIYYGGSVLAGRSLSWKISLSSFSLIYVLGLVWS